MRTLAAWDRQLRRDLPRPSWLMKERRVKPSGVEEAHSGWTGVSAWLEGCSHEAGGFSRVISFSIAPVSIARLVTPGAAAN